MFFELRLGYFTFFLQIQPQNMLTLCLFFCLFTQILTPLWVFEPSKTIYSLFQRLVCSGSITAYRKQKRAQFRIMVIRSLGVLNCHALCNNEARKYGICHFWQLNCFFGGGVLSDGVPPPLRYQELQKLYSWKFYQMLLSIRRHEIKKNWHNSSGL